MADRGIARVEYFLCLTPHLQGRFPCPRADLDQFYTNYLSSLVTPVAHRQSYSMRPVSTGMGDHLQTGKPSWYVTSHLGQLSLLPLARREMSEAVWVEGKGMNDSFHLWINVWVASKTVWSHVNRCHN